MAINERGHQILEKNVENLSQSRSPAVGEVSGYRCLGIIFDPARVGHGHVAIPAF